MVSYDLREQIHKLVDEANEQQLDAVLTLLQPSSIRYTQEELDAFNNNLAQFREAGSQGYGIEATHSWIREKYKSNGL